MNLNSNEKIRNMAGESIFSVQVKLNESRKFSNSNNAKETVNS